MDTTPPATRSKKKRVHFAVGSSSPSVHPPHPKGQTSNLQSENTTRVSRRSKRLESKKAADDKESTASPRNPIGRSPVGRDEPSRDANPTGDSNEDYIVDKVIDHGYSDDGELRFQVRWYGYDASGDTWEPIEHLRRSQVMRYIRQAKLATRKEIDKARDG